METAVRIRAAKKKMGKMKLEQFIALYDVPGSVVLLEGKREVPNARFIAPPTLYGDVGGTRFIASASCIPPP